MSVPFFQKKAAIRGVGIALASSLLISVAAVSVASAQMGPMPPREKPQRDNPVVKTLGKMFKQKKDEAAAEESADEQAAQGEAGQDVGPQAASGKPKVSAPPDAEEVMRQAPAGRPPMLTQPPLENAKIEPPQVDEQNPPPIDHPKLDDPTNPLGLTDAANRLQKLSKLVDAKRYYEAKPGLAQLRQWLVDLTEAHIGLYKVLNQLPSARAQAELEKELALQFAQLRDRTMMEMARVYISEKEYPKAIKELTEVVKSQPRSKVGLQSYELLQEIGFTEKLQLTQ
jgi:tetratricopeptide (TPR) repeat protein